MNVDLRVVQGDGWKETLKRDGSPSGHMVRDLRPVAVDDVVAWLLEHGATTGEVIWEHGHGYYIPIDPDGDDPEGKAYLVFRMEDV